MPATEFDRYPVSNFESKVRTHFHYLIKSAPSGEWVFNHIKNVHLAKFEEEGQSGPSLGNHSPKPEKLSIKNSTETVKSDKKGPTKVHFLKKCPKTL